jgi:DnaK suppressor protein
VAKPAPVKAKPAPAKPVAKVPAKAVAPAPKKVVAPPVKAVAKKDAGKASKKTDEKHAEDPIIAELIKPEVKESTRRPRPKSFPKPEPAKPLEKVPTPVKQLPTPIVRENKNRAMVSTATSPTTNLVNSKDAPNMRYSDKELKEFKELIEQKLESAREELKALKASLDNHNDSQSGSKAWNMEEGTDTSEMEYLMNQISRQHTYIRNLELALVRVENKTYGICRATGLLIPKERLRVVPHATLSIEAKNNRRPEDHPVQSVAPPVLGDGGDGGPSFED